MPLFAANFTSTWIGFDGIWGNPNNWSTPDAFGTFPNNGASTYDAVLSNSGTRTLDQNITIERLTLSAGAVIGSGDLTLNENLIWSEGTLDGTGTTTVAGAASTISGNQFGVNKFLARTLINSGTMTLSSGSLIFGSGSATPGVLNNSGTFNMTDTGGMGDGGHPNNAINNSGTWNASGATFVGVAFNNTGTVAVNSGAMSVNGAFNNTGTVAVNSGELSLAGGNTGTTTGDFNVSGGATLRLGGNFTLGATADVAGVGNVDFGFGGTINVGGTYNITGISSVSGATVNFNAPVTGLGTGLNVFGGMVNFNTPISSLGTMPLSVSGGTVNFNASLPSVVTGPLSVSGGTVNFNSNDVTVSAINLSSDDLIAGGTLSGPATVSTSNLVWSGTGKMVGTGTTNVTGTVSTISVSGGDNFPDFNVPTLARILNNSGTITYSSSDSTALIFGSNDGLKPGVLNNSGTFNVTDGASFGANLGPDPDPQDTPNPNNAINNSGTWNVSGAGSLSSVGIAFNNTGSVNVTRGGLSLESGGTSTGSFATSAGATLLLADLNDLDVSHLLDNGTAFTGPGLVTFGFGSVTVGNAATDVISATNVEIAAELGGSGTFNIGNLTWTGFSMSGTGTTNVAGTASTISDRPFPFGGKLLARTLNNRGIMTYSSDDFVRLVFGATGDGVGVLNNSGTFNVTAGGDFGDSLNTSETFGRAINNSGTWNVSGAGSTSEVFGTAFSNTGTVNVTSGNLVLGGGGTSAGTFAISAGAALSFMFGTHLLDNATTFTGAGLVSVSVGGTVTVGDAAPDVITGETFAISDGGTLNGLGTFNIGNLVWTEGMMSGTGKTNAAGAASTISSSDTKVLDRTLSNSGTTTYSTSDFSGPLSFGNDAGVTSGVLNNSGTFNVTAGGDFAPNANNSGTHAINNSGTWNTSGTGTTSTVFGIAFNNTGTVNVTNGTLALYGGGTSTGSFAISAGATLNFSLGTHLLDNGTTFTGVGLASVINDTVTAGDAASDVITAATFGVSGGSLNGLGTFNIGNLIWTGGTMEGTGTTNAAGAASAISGSVAKALDRTLNNSGTITFSSSNTNRILFGLNSDLTPGVLNNSGTFNVTAGGDFAQNFANRGHAINNSGTWNVSGANVTSDVTGIAFNNTGTVNIASGTLALGGGGTNTGNFAISAGATLSFADGTHFLNAGVSFTGAGFVNVAGGAVTAGQSAPVTITAANFGISGGILDGAGMLSIGNFTWTGGTMEDTGVTSVSGVASTISGTSLKGLNRTLNNSGTTTYSSGDGRTIFFGFNGSEPGVLNNTGIFNVTAGGDFTQGIGNPEHAINNSGTWNVSGATFTSHVTGIAFHNAGAVNITSGTFALGGGGTNTGSFATSAGATLSFTAGTHLLDNGVTFTGAGAARVSGGTVAAGDGPADVIAATNFGVSGGTLDGLGTLQTGNFTWTAGTMRGTGTTAVSGAAATISGNGQKGLDRKLNNSGTITYSTSDSSNPIFFGLHAGETGVLNNTGTFNVTAGGDFSRNYASASHAINNSGVWNVTGAGTTSNVTGIVFSNTGTVNVQTGTLALNGGDGGSTTGDFNVNAGAVLQIAGSFTFESGSNFAGAGSVVFSAGTSQLHSGGHTVAAINVAGGILHIGVSQTLPALHIGAAGVVSLGNGDSAPQVNLYEESIEPLIDGFAGGSAIEPQQPLPEPGGTVLLLGGLFTLMGWPRRASR